MKVTMLSNTKGGVFTYTTDLVQGLTSKGYDVEVFFLNQPVGKQIGERTYYGKFLTTRHSIPDLRVLFSFFFSDRSDLIHINFSVFGPLAILKKLVFRIPFILVLHGLPPPWLQPALVEKIKYTIESLLIPYVASRASNIVCVSNYVKSALKARYGFDSGVIYNGIDADRMEPLDKQDSKKQIGYKEGDFLGLYVAKLHPYKDPLTLVKAFDLVVKENKNVHLALIGTGELKEKVKLAISRLDLSNCVRMIDHVDENELRQYYSAADFFVLPSIDESFGIVLLEAMSAGLPIIAANSGACPEVIGSAGVLFRQGDFHDLANKIVTMSRNREMAEELAKAAYSRVREVFSLETMIERYWKLYEKVSSTGSAK